MNDLVAESGITEVRDQLGALLQVRLRLAPPLQENSSRHLERQPHWEETFTVKPHPDLPSWCLFKKSAIEGELQEAVFAVQGVVTQLQLPPLEKIPKYASLH